MQKLFLCRSLRFKYRKFVCFVAMLFTLLAVASVQPTHAQEMATKKISLKLNNATIKEAFAVIQQQGGFKFVYGPDINKYNTVKVTLNGSYTVKQAIDQVLKNTNLRYTQRGSNVMIDEKPEGNTPAPRQEQTKAQQNGRISGKVLDDRGEPLIGASIRVVGNTSIATQSATDGSYSLSLKPGTYALEVSYISFQTQRITDIAVKDNSNTPLTISMKAETNTLSQVVVSAGYKKASVAGLYAEQKNRASVSNGISAEQIGATPDKNIGETLKRISGISSVDNKFVLVRGIGERYNAATLDGTVLPSTEAQNRSFSFDMIPSNMVDNVVVNKTVTPDMNANFGGGLIQINTKDIPNENFMSFSAGASYNDQSTGKDFLSHKRGKYDYLGFDDGGRDFPKDLFSVSGLNLNQEMDRITEQSKRFTNDNFTIYKNPTAPSQNYQFTIGRLFALDTTNSRNKFGFTGSLSYRNNQNINNIDETRRSRWDNTSINTGNSYGFNTTWGGLLNMGLQLGVHRLSLRNTYTRIYDNTLVRIAGYNDEYPFMTEAVAMQKPNTIEEADNPTFTSLLQNKLAGQHQLNKVKLEWEFARTAVDRKEKDLGISEQILRKVGTAYDYFYNYSSTREPRIKPASRQNYHNSEAHYSWNVAGTLPFDLGAVRNSVKVGYFGLQKKSKFDWQVVSLAAMPNIRDSLRYLPVNHATRPENMGNQGFLYMPWYNDYYEGKSQNHAGYVVFDNRFTDQWRLVWGVRAEYYEYTEINNAVNGKEDQYGRFTIKPDKKLQWMPSANLTYSPLSSLNIRAAYSSSMVRPEMMDNSKFYRYSAYFGGSYGSQGLYSTRIDSWDAKVEWFPGLGEIISAGAFYKNFDKPAELTYSYTASGAQTYSLVSSDWAKVWGLEFELRKSLGFIYDTEILHNLSAYGNLTLQKSEVKSTYFIQDPNDPTQTVQATMKENRPMYGQTPYMMNAGLQYAGERFGANLVYNKTGLRTAMVSDLPEYIEYEQPREQLDAQISYRFLKKRLEVKINAGNILNTASILYRNFASYERNPDFEFNGDLSNAQRLKEGFTEKYEEGDLIMFKQRFGRTFSTSLTYTF